MLYVRDLTPATAREVAWHWASAEINSPRFGHLYRPNLSQSILVALTSGDQTLLTEEEWNDLESVVSGVRAPLLRGLNRLGTTWYVGQISSEDLVDLRLLNLPAFRGISTRLRLAEFVEALDRQEGLPGVPEFAPHYWALKTGFEPTQIRGTPILVSMNAAGPYGILEGYSRLAVMLSRDIHGNPVTDLRVMLGVCTRIREWRLNDDPMSVALYWDSNSFLRALAWVYRVWRSVSSG